jgi:putative transposase
MLLGEVSDGHMRLSEIGRIAAESWQALPDHFSHVELDTFAIMPNHLHGIISIGVASGSGDHHSPGPKAGSLDAVLGAFKAAASRRANQLGETPETPLWQRGYHARALRNERAIAAMRDYIAANPAAWEQDPLNPDSARFRPYCPLPARLIS